MPRPTSQSQLLTAATKEHLALEEYLAKLTPDQLSQAGIVGDWAAKDVLAHLTAWEQMVINWYQTGKRGETPQTPAPDLTWRQIPELNQRIYLKHRDEPLDVILSRFHASHKQIMEVIEGMTNDELFTPQVYAWTKTTTLGSYFVSATSSHYEWARKEIRKGINRAG